jgi:hypothetical protein
VIWPHTVTHAAAVNNQRDTTGRVTRAHLVNVTVCNRRATEEREHVPHDGCGEHIQCVDNGDDVELVKRPVVLRRNREDELHHLGAVVARELPPHTCTERGTVTVTAQTPQ